MFVDFLEKSVVEDLLAKVGKSLGFSLKHSTLVAGQGRAAIRSPLWWWYEYEPNVWWWYEYEPNGEEDSKAAGKVLLCHSDVYQDTSLTCYYTESALMLEDVLATREFTAHSSRHALPAPRISNPFAGTKSLEELQIKLDLLGEKKKESHDGK